MINCKHIQFRRGDTSTVMMRINSPIGEGMKLKVGIYTISGKPLFETIWPDGGRIKKIDDNTFCLELQYSDTIKLTGPTTLRLALFKDDLSFVNAGENAMQLTWSPEPVNERLK